MATPAVTCVGVLVQAKPPPPPLAARLSVVVLSRISVLPATSSSATVTLKAVPAGTVAGGGVVYTSFVAGPMTWVVAVAEASPVAAAVSVYGVRLAVVYLQPV